MILAADIGGTRCRFALARPDGASVQEAEYPSAEFDNLEAAIDRFLREHGQAPEKVERVALALAGPVSGDCVPLTNLPWLVCRSSLEKQLAGASVAFINDFQAAALGVLQLPAERLLPLNPARELAGGRKLVVGAGTGLGVAYLHAEEGGYRPWPTEAGHMSFAPVDHQQWELAKHLRRKHGRASWERVLSGPGLSDLHAFLAAEAPPLEPAEVIDAAAQGRSASAMEAVSLFSRLYGSFCGDLALAWQPAGGIYLTGGVTLHLGERLARPPFLEAFRDKGRMSSLVAGYPVQIVMEPRVGLMGALRHAVQQVKRDE